MVIQSAYEHAEENQLRTARLLGISRNVVRARLLQFGMLTSGSRDGDGADDGDGDLDRPADAARRGSGAAAAG